MRVSIGGDTACRRWLVDRPRQGVAGMYFMPDEFKQRSQHLKASGEKQAGAETRDTPPLLETPKTFQVGVNPCMEEGSVPERTPEREVKPESVSVSNLKENTPLSLGLSLSPPNPPAQNSDFLSGAVTSFNGNTDLFWQLADSYRDLAANTLALKFQAACGVVLTGVQVQQLLAKGRPKATDSVPQPIYSSEPL